MITKFMEGQNTCKYFVISGQKDSSKECSSLGFVEGLPNMRDMVSIWRLMPKQSPALPEWIILH